MTSLWTKEAATETDEGFHNPYHDLDANDIVQRMSFWTRAVLWAFGARLNRELFYPVLGRCHERGMINSRVLHCVHHHFDPTQNGVVGRIRLPRK